MHGTDIELNRGWCQGEFFARRQLGWTGRTFASAAGALVVHDGLGWFCDGRRAGRDLYVIFYPLEAYNFVGRLALRLLYARR